MKPNFVPAPPSKNRVPWCGPYALAVINGLDYDVVDDILKRSERRSRRVMGFGRDRMVRASRSKKLPVKVEFEELKRPVTVQSLGDYLRPHRLHIARVRGHYVVINPDDMTVIDNQSQKWVPVREHKYARCRTTHLAVGARFEINHDSNIDSTTAEEAVV